jgi:N-acetylglutamate synthase-like GNAT family acetyltransferase
MIATLREVRDDDWPAILALANRSVAEVAGAGPQDEWLRNRRRPKPVRRELVAEGAAGVVGYVAVESEFDRVPDGFRVFVVTSPDALRVRGAALLERALGELAALRAREAWFVEYASDLRFLSFLEGHGFERVRSFRLESGSECLVLRKRLAPARA